MAFVVDDDASSFGAVPESSGFESLIRSSIFTQNTGRTALAEKFYGNELSRTDSRTLARPKNERVEDAGTVGVLVERTGNDYSPAYMIMAAGLITLVALRFHPETYRARLQTSAEADATAN